MNNSDKRLIYTKAIENYNNNTPWPIDDPWHKVTYKKLYTYVNNWILNNSKAKDIILNAGSGNTEYTTESSIIYLDIIEDYIKKYENHIVSSIDNIPLEELSVDIIICVGSILNYADVQKSISEFSRILKTNSTLIIEFERSNSAEFLFTKNYSKTIFSKEYSYNKQTHYLWLYNEYFIRKLLNYYGFEIKKTYRYHSISSLLNRIGITEKIASKFAILDSLIAPFSYFIAHNVIITAIKVKA